MGTTTKALQLLGEFCVSRPEIGLSEFCRLTGRDKATVYRHLSELEAIGYVEQNAESKLYRLGPAVLRLAAVREASFPVKVAVAPIVEALSQDVGELVHFSLLQGHALAPVSHADVNVHGTRVFFDEGEMLPLNATASGIAILAFGPTSLLEDYLTSGLDSFTAQTPITPDELRDLIESARHTGWSTSDRTFDPEVVSHAVPVFDASGQATGTLAVALPVSRATQPMRDRAVAGLIATSPKISSALGGVVPAELKQVWTDAA